MDQLILFMWRGSDYALILYNKYNFCILKVYYYETVLRVTCYKDS